MMMNTLEEPIKMNATIIGTKQITTAIRTPIASEIALLSTLPNGFPINAKPAALKTNQMIN